MLVRTRAFVVKRLGKAEDWDNVGQTGQISWAKNGGPKKSWEIAKAKALWRF